MKISLLWKKVNETFSTVSGPKLTEERKVFLSEVMRFVDAFTQYHVQLQMSLFTTVTLVDTYYGYNRQAAAICEIAFGTEM